MLRGRLVLPLSLASAMFASSGCLPEFPEARDRQDGDAGAAGPTPYDPGPEDDAGHQLPPRDPHALLGVEPPHGPFSGGQRRIVRGHGFSSKVRIWFGPNEVPAADIVPIDPNRVQVIVPEGLAGPVDIRAQNGDDASTERALAHGYEYDAFYAEPSTGPTAGGIRISLHGQGTRWDADTTVSVGGKPCEDLSISSETELGCALPKHSPGAKSITITTSDGETTTALSAFIYADSDDGFRGGLSGGKLDSSLKVLALNSYTGDPIQGAVVIAGDSLESSLQKTTDASGVALFQDASLGPARSVTIAAKCHHPMSFVDVPVDTVTAYLPPVISPACAEGDPPAVGGRPGYPGRARGELLWPFVAEFKRGIFSNVPSPILEGEERVAYIFNASANPADDFRFPDRSQAIRPTDLGPEGGFVFDITTPVGNLSLYALAGIENRNQTPRRFTAYSMGIVQGVTTTPGHITRDIFLEMDILLEHAISITVDSPARGPRGPDRLRATAAVEIGNSRYAILPGMQKTTLLSATNDIDFIGLPALNQALSGARYVLTARAATGSALGLPLSVMESLATHDSSRTVRFDDYVSLPVLASPAQNESWDGKHLELTFQEGGHPVDLVVYDISLGGGLITWTVVSPGEARDITLPDLASISSDLGILPGLVKIRVHAARIHDFEYGNLLSRHLTRSGWNSYAIDESVAHLR